MNLTQINAFEQKLLPKTWKNIHKTIKNETKSYFFDIVTEVLKPFYLTLGLSALRVVLNQTHALLIAIQNNLVGN